VLSEFWTPTTIAVILTIRIKDLHTEVLVIAHYSPTTQQRTTDDELTFFLNNARKKHPRHDIVVAGDLNRDLNSAIKLSNKFNLSLCQQEKVIPTYINTRRDAKQEHTQTDYILSSTQSQNTSSSKELTHKTSDHLPLATNLTLNPLPIANSTNKQRLV